MNSACSRPMSSGGKSVWTRGVDREIISIVMGMSSMAVYFTEDEKTVFTSSGSFSGFSFEKAGNSTFDMGKLMKVTSIEK